MDTGDLVHELLVPVANHSLVCKQDIYGFAKGNGVIVDCRGGCAKRFLALPRCQFFRGGGRHLHDRFQVFFLFVTLLSLACVLRILQ
jgi:hypothetical protein